MDKTLKKTKDFDPNEAEVHTLIRICEIAYAALCRMAPHSKVAMEAVRKISREMSKP